MFPYHNRLKQLLASEQYIVQKESGTFAYRFTFPEIGKSMPIRAEKVFMYEKYLEGVM